MNLLFNLLGICLIGVSQCFSICTLLKLKNTYKKSNILFLSFFYILMMLLLNNYNNGLKMPIVLVTLVIALYLRIKNSFIFLVVSVCISYFILITGDLLLSVLYLTIFNLPIELIKENYIISFAVNSAISAWIFIITLCLHKLWLKGVNLKLKAILPRQKIHLLQAFQLVLTVAIVFINIYIFRAYSLKSIDTSLIRIIPIANLSLIIINLCIDYITVSTYTTYKRQETEYENKIRDYEQLKIYIEQVENMSHEIRRFRHDYSNVLYSIEGYIQSNDIDGLKSYMYTELIPDNNKIIHISRYVSELDKLNQNPGLKGLLSSKFTSSTTKGITISLIVDDGLFEIPVDTIDICRIVGILLDNAIEAVEGTINNEIYFGIIKGSSCITISIANRFNEPPPPVEEMFKEGFSTKGQNRGLGLSIVKDIIYKKYPNVLLSTLIDKNTIIQEMHIMVDLQYQKGLA